MAGNQTNGGANNGSISIGMMNVPLSGARTPPVDVVNGGVGRSNIRPLNLFPETGGPQVGETSTPPATMHFLPITPAVVSEGIIQLTTDQYTAFPTPAGVGSVRGIQSDSRECYNAAVKLAEKRSVNVLYLLEAPPPHQEVLRIEEVPHVDEPDLDPRILDHAAAAQAAEDTIEDHVVHLQAMFDILRRYKMWLNPLKCVFGVGSGKFLGFMVNQQGIEANPGKIRALVEMPSPTKPKEILKGNKKFQWTEKCEEAFKALKTHLGQPPILSKPMTGEVLSIYLAVSEYAISSVLIREDQGRQYPVYYVSKRLLGAETRYPQMEKLAFALVISSRKL
ncbi:uncharacterized protein LOC133031455 [Cannabis sativa]|uniref:uncharacterized protein LOC133031455 n=1 Tax=Cannabis sativa TaxID=3483 RepID=UPI0029CA87B6|nr:uncharacterized protein LOC133031455 [Cannabis sativa]